MNSSLETFVPLQFKRKKGKLLVSAHDVGIIEAVARAMHWHDLLDSGTFKSVVEIARAEGLMPCGPDRAHPQHTQNGREPRVVCGKQKWKRPTEMGWALDSGGGTHPPRKPRFYT